MSFNRLNYDTCSYQHSLAESVGPGEYMLTEPPNVNEPCFAQSPQIRLQRQGVNYTQNMPLIDVDSELMNLTRPATNCPSRKYIPDGNQCNESHKLQESKNNLTHGNDCFFDVEDTRLSNPPCNLRGTGWNRWEWLCLNPQDRVLMPFDYNINNRLVVKDNRPCIPKPIDVSLSLPPQTPMPSSNNTVSTCGVPTGPQVFIGKML